MGAKVMRGNRGLMVSLLVGGAAVFAPVAHAGPCDVAQVQATTQSRKTQDVVKSTGWGAIAGGLAGGIIGNNVGEGDAQTGAAIGAVLGGAGGFLVGQEAANRRERFETESAYLECQIETANKSLAAQQSQIDIAKAELAATLQEVAELNVRAAAGNATTRELRAKRQSLKEDLERYDVQLTDMNKQLAFYAQLEAGGGNTASDDPQVLAMRRQELSGTRLLLEAKYNELNQIRDETQLAMNSVATKNSG
jgi:outer membrane lipoprotein SlyB